MDNCPYGENVKKYIYFYCKMFFGSFWDWETNRFYNNVFIPSETYFVAVKVRYKILLWLNQLIWNWIGRCFKNAFW